MSVVGKVMVCAVAALGFIGAAAFSGAQSLGAARVAVARGASATEVINIRQQGFKRLGAAFKLIHKELSGATPDAAKIAAAVADIKATSDVIGTWFPAGSGPQAGVKTQAKTEIWSDASGFAATRAAYIRQAEKSVRQLTDPAQRPVWKDSSAALGQACKDCHDSYREKG
jgi:cytochrome c556